MHPQLPPVIPYTNQPRLLGLTYRTVPYFPKVTMLNGFQEKLTLLHTSLIIEMTTLMTELQLKTSLFNVAAVAVTDVLVHLPLPMVVVTVTAAVVVVVTVVVRFKHLLPANLQLLHLDHYLLQRIIAISILHHLLQQLYQISHYTVLILISDQALILYFLGMTSRKIPVLLFLAMSIKLLLIQFMQNLPLVLNCVSRNLLLLTGII